MLQYNTASPGHGVGRRWGAGRERARGAQRTWGRAGAGERQARGCGRTRGARPARGRGAASAQGRGRGTRGAAGARGVRQGRAGCGRGAQPGVLLANELCTWCTRPVFGPV